ncbi:isocitrate dehydrogenase [NAD] subunit gamma, mitochondrial-like [Clavelina lepadiformis]|uniref:isocitrate dehydrogenase [NAD] subunit gamma, mitochondrial-like n=1 Tax=Clavelina lepadiformis TaxID=159417 RepID=UPI00404204CD
MLKQLTSKPFPRIFNQVLSNGTSHKHSSFNTIQHKYEENTRKLALYGGRQTITMIPGDGIGPEVMDAVKKVFLAAGVPVDFEEVPVTSANFSPDVCCDAITSIKRNLVAIKGNIETDVDRLDFDQKSANVTLRTSLDLFANVIKVKSVPGVKTRHDNIDIRLIRENTEGEYSNLEHEGVPGVVESLKIITAESSLRIARFAFEYAQRNNRKKVTAVHKANIMKLGDGLFLECCREVAKDFPDIEFNDMIIDNTTMQLVSNPWQFDVMVMPNLYGNIVGNVCCGLVGGPGIVAGANIGNKYRVFETATRNTGKSIAGWNIANPAAMLFSSALMLKYVGLHKYASLINHAVVDTLQVDKIHTPDLGGSNQTSEVVDAVCQKVEKQAFKVRYDQIPEKLRGW